MVRSMTGFGRGESALPDGKITVEIKTINHKFLDTTLKLPESMMLFEEKIKELAQKEVKRGKAYMHLSYEGSLTRDEMVRFNTSLAKKYYVEMVRLKRELGLSSEIAIKDIVNLPGVINHSISEKGFLKLWPRIKEAVERALSALVKDREREGKATKDDLSKRVRLIDKMVAIIKTRAHLNIEEYKKKFSDKIKGITNGRDIDVGRLEMEVAIYAKNCDISEELARLEHHLSNFKVTLNGRGEVGKKLDFIAQELHREINTIGSKASDFKISKSVIEIKSEVEKIREQVKNLE